MKRGILSPVLPGVATIVLLTGLAGCGSTDPFGAGLDDYLGEPAPREFSSDPDDPSVAPPARTGPGQPAIARTQPTAPRPQQAPQPQQAPRVAEGQPTPGGPQLLGGQQARAQPTTSGPTSLTSAQPRPQPQPVPQPPTQQATAQPAPTSGQGSLSDAARAAQSEDDGRRVVSAPEPGATSELERRIDSLFGSSAPAPVAEASVAESEIVGNWVLNEEDGLRTCQMTFTARDAGSRVTAAQGCSGTAAQVTSWGLFGSDLLLNDASKTVVARLRPSGDRWFGFTLGTGIPIVLSRNGQAS